MCTAAMCVTDGKETTESVRMPTGVQESLI